MQAGYTGAIDRWTVGKQLEPAVADIRQSRHPLLKRIISAPNRVRHTFLLFAAAHSQISPGTTNTAQATIGPMMAISAL